MDEVDAPREGQPDLPDVDESRLTLGSMCADTARTAWQIFSAIIIVVCVVGGFLEEHEGRFKNYGLPKKSSTCVVA